MDSAEARALALPFRREAWPAPELSGSVELVRFESRLLLGHAPWTSALRSMALYAPSGTSRAGLPLVFLLPGFGATWRRCLEVSPWQPGLVQCIDRAMAHGACPPALLALPDPWTRLGGSQWVDSAFHGPFSRHFAEELLPLALSATEADGARVALCGKSSGGFGAVHLAMEHPGLFRAIASLSGDCAFELCYAHEFPVALRAFRGDPAGFLRAFLEEPRLDGERHAAINLLAMSACYSPDASEPMGFALPCDSERAELRSEVWSRWLRFDPLRRVTTQGDALRVLKLLHLECGLADEFHLQWGLRRLVRELARAGIAHRHAEHPGGHRGTDPRFLAVLPDLIAC